MSLYQREGSPFWWYDFTVNGQRFRGSTGKETKREAKKVEDDEKRRARDGNKRPAEWRLHDLCRTYYDQHARDKRSAPTILYQLAKLRDIIGKDRRLLSITNATMMDFRQAREREGVSVSSVNREIVILRAAMRFAAEMHEIPVPRLSWTKLMKEEPPHRIRFLSFDEYRALVDSAHVQLRPIIICAVTTGLRKDNILRLDWSQVKLGHRVIQTAIKGNKAHTVRISNQLSAILSTTAPDARTGIVFPCPNFEKRWRAAVKAAAITDLRFHDLRHTFASWARQSGADLADLKEGMGHSDISMTLRYAHIKPDSTETAFDRVSDAIASQSTPHRLVKG